MDKMTEYKVTYIGIGGYERYIIIDAYTPFEAREKFKETCWAWHEIVNVEELG